MGFIILIMLFAALVQYLEVKNYNKSNYKKETGYPYTKVRFNSGVYGEYLSFNILNKIEGHKRILANVYVPKEKGGTTEIDVVMIHEKGIFVIESKNYSGWIFGDEKNKTWTQSFKNGRKEKFYNPIWQNQSHIRHLSKLLNIEDKNIMKSIIAFSERCTLKKLQVYSEGIRVINRNELEKTVNRMILCSCCYLEREQVDEIYNKLKSYSNVSEEVKRMHVEEVREMKG